MKICLITRGFSLHWGGAERVAVNLAKSLATAGHEVSVIAAAADVIPDGMTVRVLKTVRFFSACKIISFQRAVRRIVDRQGFDLVYGLCQVYPVDIYRVGGGIQRHWMRVQFPDVPSRIVKYLSSPVHLAMLVIEDRLFRNPGKRIFITNSMLIKDQIVGYYGVPEERITVIYNGIDHGVFNQGVRRHRLEMRQRCGIRDEDTVLLFASNNWKRKGLATVIDAIPHAGAENIVVAVAGRGEKAPYVSLARKKGVNADRMFFAGHVKDIEKWYGMADVFVLPSRYEPFANVCLEAMACGLPVITTKTNGASEIITPGEDGFILEDWKDSATLSTFLSRLADKDLLRKMGEKAARKATGFTWERHLEEMERVLTVFREQN